MKKPVGRAPARRPAKAAGASVAAEVGAPVGAESLLSGLFANLDEVAEAARQRVEALEGQLATARREWEVVQGLLALRDGKAPKAPASSGGISGGGGRAKTAPASGRGPRGEAGKRIASLLADHPDGLKAGEIIAGLQVPDSELQSYRNAMAAGKRSGSIGYDESSKRYLPVA